MTTPLYTIDTFPTTSQAAMREFDDRYLAAVGAAPPPTWTDAGDLLPTGSPLVSFPIANMAIQYLQTQGESRFRTLLEKSFDMKAQEFDAGVEGKLLDILQQTFAYRNWQAGPARLMLAEGRFRNKQIAALLEDGENQKWGGAATPIDDANFFSATHLSDFSDADSTTWSNYQSSTKDVVSIANLEAEVTAMQGGVLDENGDKMDADPDTILVPTAKYESLKNLLAQEMILHPGTSTTDTTAGGVSNPYKGRFNLVRIPEFTDANDWYLVDSKLRASQGLTPWISLRYTVPNPALQLRQYDESSDYFKDTGRIKVSSHIWYGFALGFPHAIRKVKGA